ncbi:hypothetical protein BN59_02544 [Legionella massiliensis]|uniref:Uncharacterized protein n=1 Tax=Legionella massiliensis TaxID=1034943 RepID=A0A078KZ75_9GAMM|nr:hypothetical protein [Legionella massiliensis]CDZ78236.1 hypothetical protein BN59_02544 [Legionella massiliensis]CEE13974.1 hypothetical protein BN1094_02544 [Legionella massiliensis]
MSLNENGDLVSELFKPSNKLSHYAMNFFNKNSDHINFATLNSMLTYGEFHKLSKGVLIKIIDQLLDSPEQSETEEIIWEIAKNLNKDLITHFDEKRISKLNERLLKSPAPESITPEKKAILFSISTLMFHHWVFQREITQPLVYLLKELKKLDENTFNKKVGNWFAHRTLRYHAMEFFNAHPDCMTDAIDLIKMKEFKHFNPVFELDDEIDLLWPVRM